MNLSSITKWKLNDSRYAARKDEQPVKAWTVFLRRVLFCTSKLKKSLSKCTENWKVTQKAEWKFDCNGQFLDFVYDKRTFSSNWRIRLFHKWRQNQSILPSFWGLCAAKTKRFAVMFLTQLKATARRASFAVTFLKNAVKNSEFAVTLDWEV